MLRGGVEMRVGMFATPLTLSAAALSWIPWFNFNGCSTMRIRRGDRLCSGWAAIMPMRFLFLLFLVLACRPRRCTCRTPSLSPRAHPVQRGAKRTGLLWLIRNIDFYINGRRAADSWPPMWGFHQLTDRTHMRAYGEPSLCIHAQKVPFNGLFLTLEEA